MLNAYTSLAIFSWEISGLLQTPIGSFWYLYLPPGIKIVHRCLAPWDKSIWYYHVFKSKDNAYMKLSRFSSISCILGVGNSFIQILWFSLLKLGKNLTVPLFFSWIKVGTPHSSQITFLIPPIRTIVQLTYIRLIFVLEAPSMAFNDKVWLLAVVWYLQV